MAKKKSPLDDILKMEKDVGELERSIKELTKLQLQVSKNRVVQSTLSKLLKGEREEIKLYKELEKRITLNIKQKKQQLSIQGTQLKNYQNYNKILKSYISNEKDVNKITKDLVDSTDDWGYSLDRVTRKGSKELGSLDKLKDRWEDLTHNLASMRILMSGDLGVVGATGEVIDKFDIVSARTEHLNKVIGFYRRQINPLTGELYSMAEASDKARETEKKQAQSFVTDLGYYEQRLKTVTDLAKREEIRKSLDDIYAATGHLGNISDLETERIGSAYISLARDIGFSDKQLDVFLASNQLAGRSTEKTIADLEQMAVTAYNMQKNFAPFVEGSEEASASFKDLSSKMGNMIGDSRDFSQFATAALNSTASDVKLRGQLLPLLNSILEKSKKDLDFNKQTDHVLLMRLGGSEKYLNALRQQGATEKEIAEEKLKWDEIHKGTLDATQSDFQKINTLRKNNIEFSLSELDILKKQINLANPVTGAVQATAVGYEGINADMIRILSNMGDINELSKKELGNVNSIQRVNEEQAKTYAELTGNYRKITDYVRMIPSFIRVAVGDIGELADMDLADVFGLYAFMKVLSFVKTALKPLAGAFAKTETGMKIISVLLSRLSVLKEILGKMLSFGGRNIPFIGMLVELILNWKRFLNMWSDWLDSIKDSGSFLEGFIKVIQTGIPKVVVMLIELFMRNVKGLFIDLPALFIKLLATMFGGHQAGALVQKFIDNMEESFTKSFDYIYDWIKTLGDVISAIFGNKKWSEINLPKLGYVESPFSKTDKTTSIAGFDTEQVAEYSKKAPSLVPLTGGGVQEVPIIKEMAQGVQNTNKRIADVIKENTEAMKVTPAVALREMIKAAPQKKATRADVFSGTMKYTQEKKVQFELDNFLDVLLSANETLVKGGI